MIKEINRINLQEIKFLNKVFISSKSKKITSNIFIMIRQDVAS